MTPFQHLSFMHEHAHKQDVGLLNAIYKQPHLLLNSNKTYWIKIAWGEPQVGKHQQGNNPNCQTSPWRLMVGLNMFSS